MRPSLAGAPAPKTSVHWYQILPPRKMSSGLGWGAWKPSCAASPSALGTGAEPARGFSGWCPKGCDVLDTSSWELGQDDTQAGGTNGCKGSFQDFPPTTGLAGSTPIPAPTPPPRRLTRWCAGGRGRWLARRGHRCPQTSAAGTPRSRAWLAARGGSAGLVLTSWKEAQVLELQGVPSTLVPEVTSSTGVYDTDHHKSQVQAQGSPGHCKY